MCNHKHREQTSDYKEPIRSIVQNTNTEYKKKIYVQTKEQIAKYKEKIQNINTTYEIQSGNTKNKIRYEYKVNHSP